MIALLIYMWINIGKMNALHKERMKLVEELSELMDEVQRDRAKILRDLVAFKRLREELEALEVVEPVETRSGIRPLEPPV